MKQYLIKTFREEGSRYDDYSIFRNPLEELKKKVANFKISKDTVTLGWPSVKFTIESHESDADGDIKCLNGKNIHYFPKSEVDKALGEKLKEARNAKFKAFEYFREAFGIVSYINEYQLKIINLKNMFDMSKALGGEGGFSKTTGGFYDYKLETYYYTGISMHSHGESMNLFFTEDGDFINRDYIQKLVDFECKDIKPSELVEKFKNHLRKDYKGSIFEEVRGKYYSDKAVFIPFQHNGDEDSRDNGAFGFDIIPKHKYLKDTYKKYCKPAIKKPKAEGEKYTLEQVIDRLLDSLSDELKNKLSDDYVLYF